MAGTWVRTPVGGGNVIVKKNLLMIVEPMRCNDSKFPL